jgi:hypothetical protein
MADWAATSERLKTIIDGQAILIRLGSGRFEGRKAYRDSDNAQYR